MYKHMYMCTYTQVPWHIMIFKFQNMCVIHTCNLKYLHWHFLLQTSWWWCMCTFTHSRRVGDVNGISGLILWLLGHGEWWHERHKRGSTWKSESGTWPNKKQPTDARTFCRTLRTERNRRLLVLGSPHRMIAEWVGGSAKNLGTSV